MYALPLDDGSADCAIIHQVLHYAHAPADAIAEAARVLAPSGTLLVVDFVATRRPHEVSMKEAIAWSAFYVALPLAFGGYVWSAHGGDRGLEYYTGYLVEKTLSVDNLFVFMLLLAAFAVPEVLKQRVLKSHLSRKAKQKPASPAA